ncbi:MAG: NUDIX hydrolase [Desulfobulbaceae bacterium]|jgi:8-oxo-dGTP pyrophosphatase MutT (NUDIX family)|nr:NUDIX hydrolase [Desulfobulbaceae bacterium]
MNTTAVSGFQVTDEHLVFDSPLFRIQAASVLCRRSGDAQRFYRFRCADWVNVVALTPDGKIILIRQWRYGSGAEEIEIPGGTIDAGEEPIAAGCRELREETGYVGRHAELIGTVHPNPAIQSNTTYTVLVRDAVAEGRPRFDGMEDISCWLAEQAEVWRLVDSGAIRHGLVLNALLFYQRRCRLSG